MIRSVGVSNEEDARWEGDVADTIRQLAQEVEIVDLRAFEATEPNVEMGRLVAWVDELAARAMQLMKSVSLRFDEPAAGLGELEELSFSDLESTSVRAMQTGSIAFIAQLELRQCRERLATGGSLNLVSALNECDRALRRILRGLMALDDALAIERGRSRILDDSGLLSRSLRVRACYAELNARIQRQGTPNAASITKSLRLVGTILAVLVGRDTYAELRVGDRLQLRALQFRILDWLRSSAQGGSAAMGLQLWSDILAFLAVLQQVNRRPELQQHDARVLELARSTLRDQPGLAHWPSQVFDELRTLRGKSQLFDQVLAGPEPSAVGPWRPLLTEAAPAQITSDWGS